MSEEIEWKLALPVEKADDRYLDEYIAARRNRCRARMAQTALYSRAIYDSTNALIAYIDDANEQNRLWTMMQNRIQERTDEYRKENYLTDTELIDISVMHKIRTEVSSEILSQIQMWFGKFWAGSQSIVMTFVKND